MICLLSSYVSTPLFMHTEQYDAFQVPYDINHGTPFDSAEDTYIGNLRALLSTTLGQSISRPNAAWSAACYQHCMRWAPAIL